MISRAIILLLVTCLASVAQPLRQFGTTLYDLSPLYESAAASPYLVEGEVVKVYSNAVKLRRTSGTNFYFFPSPAASSDLLHLAAAKKMSKRPISEGEYVAMSPQMRQQVEVVVEHQDMMLRNYPGPCKPGEPIRAFALPVTAPTPTWDYGTVIAAPQRTNFSNVFIISAKGMTREKPSSPEKVTK